MDLPSRLFRQAKGKAALEGRTLKALLTQYVESGLRHAIPAEPALRERSRLPTVKRQGRALIPNLTPERQANLESEEDLAKLDRSFGR